MTLSSFTVVVLNMNLIGWMTEATNTRIIRYTKSEGRKFQLIWQSNNRAKICFTVVKIGIFVTRGILVKASNEILWYLIRSKYTGENMHSKYAGGKSGRYVEMHSFICKPKNVGFQEMM